MKTATLVRKLKGWRGDARLYRVEPLMRYERRDVEAVTPFVIVSGINNEWGIETLIFPAGEDGEATDMLDLKGSFRGSIDHARALAGAGYEVTS